MPPSGPVAAPTPLPPTSRHDATAPPSKRRWFTAMRFFAGLILLAIDELGCLTLPADAASALFKVVSRR